MSLLLGSYVGGGLKKRGKVECIALLSCLDISHCGTSYIENKANSTRSMLLGHKVVFVQITETTTSWETVVR